MNLTYLYNDGEFWHFMNNETFEQLSADAKAIGDNAKWLLDQAECIVTLWKRRTKNAKAFHDKWENDTVPS